MDVEKARELLADVGALMTANRPLIDDRLWKDVDRRIDAALRALDDDGAEEWHVSCRSSEPEGRYVDRAHHNGWIAIARDDATAHRIARLPALEKAGAALLNNSENLFRYDERNDHKTIVSTYKLDALRAALKQEDQ